MTSAEWIILAGDCHRKSKKPFRFLLRQMDGNVDKASSAVKTGLAIKVLRANKCRTNSVRGESQYYCMLCMGALRGARNSCMIRVCADRAEGYITVKKGEVIPSCQALFAQGPKWEENGARFLATPPSQPQTWGDHSDVLQVHSPCKPMQKAKDPT